MHTGFGKRKGTKDASIGYIVMVAKLDVGDACIETEAQTNCIQHLCGEDSLVNIYCRYTLVKLTSASYIGPLLAPSGALIAIPTNY